MICKTMLYNMRIFITIVSLIVPLCGSWEQNFDFRRAAYRDGSDCLNGELLFTITVRSATRCAMECKTRAACLQIFYHDLDKTCRGCSTLNYQQYASPGAMNYAKAQIYLGCFEDNANRVLVGHEVHSSEMTNEYCYSLCVDGGWIYSGTQYSFQCFCGNSLAREIQKPENECNMPCSGDNHQICGGSWRINIYFI
ncbi:hypothetical protein ACF0H5_007862 [Mactra antiquata]